MHDRLVGAPIVDVQEQHTGEQSAGRDGGFTVANRADAIVLIVNDLIDAGPDTAVAQGHQAEEGNRQSADHESSPIYGIGYGDRLEAPKDRVTGSGDSDGPNHDPNRRSLTHAEDFLHIKKPVHAQCARIEHEG